MSTCEYVFAVSAEVALAYPVAAALELDPAAGLLVPEDRRHQLLIAAGARRGQQRGVLCQLCAVNRRDPRSPTPRY